MYYYPNYQQQFYQPVQSIQPIQPLQTSQAAQAAQDERIWVQGENAAMAYLVAPNGFVRLWDSTAPVFYERRADAQGKPLPMEVYTYQKRTTESVQADSKYSVLEKRIANLEAAINGQSHAKSHDANAAAQPVSGNIAGQSAAGSNAPPAIWAD